MLSILRLAAVFVFVWTPAFTAVKAETCQVEQVATLPLTYFDGMAAVSARIKGTDIEMGVDTGAQTLVTPRTAAQFRLARDRSHRTRAIGTTATTLADNVLLRNLEFAGKRYGTLTVPKIALPVPSSISYHGEVYPSGPIGTKSLAGLIGRDLLSEYDVDFDLPAKSMTLYRVRGCTAITPPWTEPYTPLAVKIAPNYNIAVPVEIDGYKLSALLDTGASGFSITRRGALKSGATEAMLKADPVQLLSGVGGVSTNQPSHKFKTFVIGTETFHDIPLQVMPARLGDSDVLIGRTYLFFRRVWISYSTRMLFVQAPKFPAEFQPPGVTSSVIKVIPPIYMPAPANP